MPRLHGTSGLDYDIKTGQFNQISSYGHGPQWRTTRVAAVAAAPGPWSSSTGGGPEQEEGSPSKKSLGRGLCFLYIGSLMSSTISTPSLQCRTGNASCDRQLAEGECKRKGSLESYTGAPFLLSPLQSIYLLPLPNVLTTVTVLFTA